MKKMDKALEKLTAEDWIIIRLLVICMGEGQQLPTRNLDLFRSIVYLYRKHGSEVTDGAYQLIKDQTKWISTRH